MNKHYVYSRVGTLKRSQLAIAAAAIALGLTSCHDDSNPNLPAIIPVPNSIVVKDVGNGAPDLLVATTADEGSGLNPGYADVIMNTPGSLGTFQTGVHYSTTGSNPSSIAVADLTGSGGTDMVIANFGNGSISVFMHGAGGTFSAAVDVSTGGQPNQVVSCDPHAKLPAVPCDLMGNGKPSLVLADMSGNVIVLLVDPGTPPQFHAPITLAALRERARELEANILLKATRVDGVYSEDPELNPHAVRYEKLTYSQVVRDNLRVMDMAAISLCEEAHLPILVFNFKREGNIERAIAGHPIGTVVAP